MPVSSLLNPHDPEFERFLYASVGHDRKGGAVAVLSAFARLQLDPWKEAEDLAASRHETAVARLALLLSRLRDVPGLGRDPGSVARELTGLLPPRPSLTARGQTAAAKRPAISSAMVWAIVAAVFLVIQFTFSGSSGSGP